VLVFFALSSPSPPPPLLNTNAEGIKLLQEGGVPDVDPYGDLNTELERTLGRIVKDKYGTDFYILHRYPMAVSGCCCCNAYLLTALLLFVPHCIL
jgi:hypothetical protein